MDLPLKEVADPGIGQTRLSDHPNWSYLLRDIYELYRFSSAGGSQRIRSHMRRVRAAVSRLVKADPPMSAKMFESKPAVKHLNRALDVDATGRLATVVQGIDRIRDSLTWQYGYDKVPAGLAKRYCFAELCGPYARVPCTEVTLGLVLFAPGCSYPAHAHLGISESYICLSGAVSENHQGVYAPGSLIFNPPEHMHRITVSDLEPALLLYAWEGCESALADQKMRLGAPHR
ncbi:MAG: dimethylsulfonioproprionate lyase family protein [Pseudomonadota bacterium]